MLSKSKIVVAVLLLIVVGGAYKFASAKPTKAAPKPKVKGQVYVLPKEFLINLAEGRYAKLSVALLLEHIPAAGSGHGATAPPEGYGTLPQEALVRGIVTNALTGSSADELERSESRHELQQQILEQLEKTTDVDATKIFFTDLTMQ